MLGPVVRGPTSPKEASLVPSAQEPASPGGPNAPVRAAPTRGHDARGHIGAQLRPGQSPDPSPKREVQPGRRCGLARADLESHAPWGASAARVRLGRDVTWPGGSRGDRAGARERQCSRLSSGAALGAGGAGSPWDPGAPRMRAPARELFRDADFPASDSSLFSSFSTPLAQFREDITWRRPQVGRPARVSNLGPGPEPRAAPRTSGPAPRALSRAGCRCGPQESGVPREGATAELLARARQSSVPKEVRGRARRLV